MVAAMNINVRLASATIIAFLLAGTLAAAQGGIRSVSAQAGATVVGTLRVDKISDSPTPIFGLGVSIVNTADSSSGGGGGAGKATFSDFTVSRQSDAVSPLLFKAAATGQHIVKVQIDVFQANSTNVEASYILSNVLVSGYSNDGSFEKIAFSFAKIEFVSGGVSSCFDLSGNLGC